MRLMFLGVLVGRLCAQTLAVSADQSTYAPGTSMTLTVSLQNSTNIATNASFQLSAPGLSFVAGCPATTSNGQTFAPGPCNLLSPDAAKTPFCFAPVASSLNCIVLGVSQGTTPPALNETPISSGPLVTIPAVVAPGTPPGPLTISISATTGNAPASDGTNDSVEVPVGGQGITITILPSRCDLNGDGKIDITDITIAANAFAANAPGSIGWALTSINVSRVLQAAITGVCKL